MAAKAGAAGSEAQNFGSAIPPCALPARWAWRAGRGVTESSVQAPGAARAVLPSRNAIAGTGRVPAALGTQRAQRLTPRVRGMDAEPGCPIATGDKLSLLIPEPSEQWQARTAASALRLPAATRCGGTRDGASVRLSPPQQPKPSAAQHAAGFCVQRHNSAACDAHTGGLAALVLRDACRLPPAAMLSWPWRQGREMPQCMQPRNWHILAIDTYLARGATSSTTRSAPRVRDTSERKRAERPAAAAAARAPRGLYPVAWRP